MLSMRQLLEKKARIAAEMRELVDGAGDETGGLTAEQQAAFDKLRQALAELEQAIQNRAVVEDMERRMTSRPIAGGSEAADRDFARRCCEYSITRAIAAAAGLAVDDGREREISAELRRRSGRSFDGFPVPIAALSRRVEQRTTTTTTPAGGPGGNLIATNLLADQFIDLLRPALVIRQLGARVLTGLVGNVDIPRQNAATIGSWIAENTALTFSDAGFDKVSLRPKHCGAITELSRNMLLQATPDIEDLLRADMAAVLARTLDAAAIAGTGAANDPTGILNTSGVTTVPIATNGGALTWPTVLAMVEAVENANAPEANRGWVGNPKIKAQAMQSAKYPAVNQGTSFVVTEYIMAGGETLAGYPFRSTTLTPSNLAKNSGTGLSALIFGSWGDLVMGLWSELDIFVNPYADAPYQKGAAWVRAMMTVDVELRHPQSFAIATDVAAP